MWGISGLAEQLLVWEALWSYLHFSLTRSLAVSNKHPFDFARTLERTSDMLGCYMSTQATP